MSPIVFWIVFAVVVIALIVVAAELRKTRKESGMKDGQIRMLMARIMELKKVINDNGIV